MPSVPQQRRTVSYCSHEDIQFESWIVFLLTLRQLYSIDILLLTYVKENESCFLECI